MNYMVSIKQYGKSAVKLALCVLLVLLSNMLFAQSAPSISCPSGFSYNSSTKQCERASTTTVSQTATRSCPSGYTYDSGSNLCRQTLHLTTSATQSCPSGQFLQNGQCYTHLSGTQCQTHANAIRSCQATNSTYALVEYDDFYGEEYIYEFKWNGQFINNQWYDVGESHVHDGYVYWVGAYDRYGWEDHYYDDYDEYYYESYYYDYYQACRCDQDQVVNIGQASTSCPSGYNYNSAANHCEVTQTYTQAPTLSCPSNYSLSSEQCYRQVASVEAVDAIFSCNSESTYVVASGMCEAVSTLPGITFVHHDVLGSPLLETDESGAVLKSFHYKPFGDTLEDDSPSEPGYTGHVYDKDIELSYMQARYYDPVIGRFYSNDPVGYTSKNPVMSFNRYLYANNNPYKYTDPDGEFLNFAVKFAADVALGVAVQVATGQKVDLKAAVVDSAQGVLNPAKTVQKLAKLGKAISSGNKTNKGSRAAGSGGGNSPCPLSCFVAGTQVLTQSGYQSIEKLNIGEFVWAKNVDTNKYEWKPITHTWIVEGKDIYQIHFEDLEGNVQTIEATESHPFYIYSKGWVNTDDLQSGDFFVNDHEQLLRVIKVESLNKKQTAYNFTVADYHTYYVTKRNVLVHNCHGNSKSSMKEQHVYMIQDRDGNIKKVGVSGQPLNKNGSSKRANSQLKSSDTATVLESGIKGRSEVLQKEGQIVEGLKKAGERLPDNKRPKIDEDNL